jgi:outer membrane protein TolC
MFSPSSPKEPYGMNPLRPLFAVLLVLIACSAASVLALAPARADSPDSELLPLAAAQTRALESHPSLQALQARISATKQRSVAAGQLPDPKLTLGMTNLPVDTFRVDQEPMTRTVQVGLQQSFPYPGTLDLRRERESVHSEILRWEKEDLRAELLRRVRSVWLERYFVQRALETIDRNLTLFEELLAIARSQYAVGMGLQQDVLLARLERDRILDDRKRLQDRATRLESRLAELMASDTHQFRLPEPMPELPAPPAQDELLAGIPGHPLVRAMDAAVRKRGASVSLAEKEFYPDFGVNLSYGHRRDRDEMGELRPDFFSATVTMDLPLFTGKRQKKSLAAARLDRTAAERQRRAKVLELQRLARTSRSSLLSTRERVELFESTILPESRQTVQADISAYVSGRIGFLEVVRSRLRTLQHELTLWRLRVEAEIAKADLLYLADQGETP